MIEDAAHKSILEEDYERHRNLAEKYRDREAFDEAADHYAKSASLLERIAELESSDRLETERRELAANLREAAENLKNAESAPENDEQDASDPPDASADSKTRGDDGAEATSYLEDPPDLDFDDVGGMTELKQTLIDTVIDPLERADLYEEYDLGVVNGVLLYGPPGTGKTYITRALAGKLGYNFIEVEPTDITSSLVGEAADNVAELFGVARENQPCLVFIDEIDAIAGQRSGGAQKTQSERQMVNQLLQELSDIQGEDIVVVAATNLLEEVDEAIRRSGRFDERIEVPPPDDAARVAILRVHLRDRPALPEEIDWETVKERTEGYSASDMELVATTAARKALQDAREADEIRKITQEHVEAAIAETESSLSAAGM